MRYCQLKENLDMISWPWHSDMCVVLYFKTHVSVIKKQVKEWVNRTCNSSPSLKMGVLTGGKNDMVNRRGEETRRHIKRNAYSLFAAKGFKQVTMKDICEAAKLSRGGLYCHYESTSQIFQAVSYTHLEIGCGHQLAEDPAHLRVGGAHHGSHIAVCTVHGSSSPLHHLLGQPFV